MNIHSLFEDSDAKCIRSRSSALEACSKYCGKMARREQCLDHTVNYKSLGIHSRQFDLKNIIRIVTTCSGLYLYFKVSLSITK